MKILLTGASGFVGGHLLEAIKQAFGSENIVVLGGSQVDGVRFVLAPHYDLSALDPRLFDDIDVLIHAGAYTPKSGAEADHRVYCGSNISFTEALLNFNFSSLRKIIFTSTLDVYASCATISEASPVEPATLYGASKLYGEKLVEVFARERKIAHAILRLGHIYGPGEEAYRKIIPLVITNALTERPVQVFGTGEELRSFIYIKDVVDAIVTAVRVELECSLINIVGGNSISINSLVEKILLASGSSTKITRIPAPKGRDFKFNNALLKNTLLKEEFDFDRGLQLEIEHMRNKLAVRQ